MKKYIITEKDFYYRPEENDEEGIVYTNEIITKVNTVKEVLEKCVAFENVFQEVEATHWFEGSIIELRSNMNSENISHPEYFYTQRHNLIVDITD